MGIISFIGGIVSGAASVISGIASTVGTAISTFAAGAVKTMSKVLEVVPEVMRPSLTRVFEVVSNVIHAIADLLGIKGEEDPTVTGMKAEQADKKPEDFDSTQDYIEYLKNDIELDKEKFAKMSEDEKLGYRAIGLSLETKAVEEKMGVEVGQDMLDVLTKIKLSDKVDISAADLLHIMQTLKKNNITNMDAFAEYLTGKGTSDRVETGIALKEAIKDMEGIEDPQAYLDSMKNAVRQYEEEE